MTGKIGAAMGIEAQREAVARLIAAEGIEVLAEVVEVETGKGCDALAEQITLRTVNIETSIPGEFRP